MGADTNLALGKDAYMRVLTDSVPLASCGNDDNLSTEVKITQRSVGAYWEVDLGETRALSSVKAIASAWIGDKLRHATIRVYDEAHESVFSFELKGMSPPDYNVPFDGPLLARYVRIGLEFHAITQTNGSNVFFNELGFNELQVWGRPANEVGILDFSVSDSTISSGQNTTLSWDVEGIESLSIYPNIGTVSTNAQGEGSLVVSPSTSTTYLMVATNRYNVFSQFVSVTVDNQPAPIQINEFLADNTLSIRDGYGDASDWVELFNPRDVAVDLTGYGLSDNPSKPMKWIFPSTQIPAQGHLLIFASGKKTSVDPKGLLHADWKLSTSGESIILTAPDGTTTLDQILAFPAQGKDLSYGRNLDGAWNFMEPTPLAINYAKEYEGWLAPIDFSHKRGFYTNAFDLVLSNPNSNSTLMVSLDGSEPQTPYSGALSITGTKTVRAAVSRPGYRAPKTKTHSYLFIENVIAAPNMNTTITQDPRYTTRIRTGLMALPSLAIAVPELPDDYRKTQASIELIWPDGSKTVQENCGMVRFGGSHDTFDKKNYRLKFSVKYGSKKFKAPLFFGMDHGFPAKDSFDELELCAGAQDMLRGQGGAYMSGRFTEDTALDMGSLNPHGRFVHLYINGTYWGQYHLRERLVQHFLADYLGGETEEYLDVLGNDNWYSSFIPGTPTPVHRDSWRRIKTLGGNYQAVKDYLDVPSLIDFMLLFFYGNTETEYRASGSVEAGSGIKFWLADADRFLRVSNTKNRTSHNGPANLFGRLRDEADPDFKILLADRIQKHLFHDGALTPEQNRARITERENQIQDSIIAESARWLDSDSRNHTPDTWLSYVENDIKTDLFGSRTAILFSQLRASGLYPPFDPPAYNQQGGSVSNNFELTMSAPAGTIYYTLDGSDPRLPGGGISPAALIFTHTITSVSLIAPDESWRYWDNGSLAGNTWRTAAYSDATWGTGPAELGYGDGDEDTLLSYGSNPSQKYITTYFRKTFTCADASIIDALTLDLLRDDGAVVYLNGVELLRDNMPGGTITSSTPASSAVSHAAESTFYSFSLPPNLLQTGENLLAVELHQIVNDSSDISFNLGLTSIQNQSQAPLVITQQTLLRSRLWTGTQWSALNEAQFLMAERAPASSENLLITEIHYNPTGYLDDHEFMELWNSGTNLVDLTGTTLSGAVDYTFPDALVLSPGEFVLVVENETAFHDRYQTAASPWYRDGLTVCGSWAGKLSNSGEEIILTAANGSNMLSIAYTTTGTWPQRADGKGSSIELKDPAQPSLVNAGHAWQSSSLYHGSPGRFDPFQREVVINEILSHTDLETDWIELHNNGLQSIDLSGLYLGDNYDAPLRYRLPAATHIPAQGYLSFGAAQLGFAFSELGSDALLTLADGTNVLRFIDTVDFPAAEREEPFGRYQLSNGENNFTELRATTKNTPNALPRIGPIVFSEIMYSPAIGKSEYVEIINITDTPVSLYDPANTNRWVLSGAVDYTFPANQTAPPCTPIIVCSTNPATFRTQYGIDASVPVYGPWQGALNNAGESLKLRQPGDPEPDGFVPYYRIDRVVYSPAAPWPTAAATPNISLQRNPLKGYGNDPITWEASPVGGTPGTVTGNHSPLVQAIGTLTAPEEQTYLLTLQGIDFDTPWQTLQLSADNLPPTATFNPATGQFSWTPTEQDGPGTFAVNFMAKDTACFPATTTQTVQIVVQEVNLAPQLAPINDLLYPAGLPWDKTLTASDPDLPAQALSYFQTGLPAGLQINPTTGQLTGTPTTPGTYTIQVIVADNHLPPLSTTNQFQLALSEIFQMSETVKTNGILRFTFPGLAGERYVVDGTDQLAPPNWQPLQTFQPNQAETLHFDDQETHPQRFYRIRWLQP